MIAQSVHKLNNGIQANVRSNQSTKGNHLEITGISSN